MRSRPTSAAARASARQGGESEVRRHDPDPDESRRTAARTPASRGRRIGRPRKEGPT
jgi:hypothetical protein